MTREPVAASIMRSASARPSPAVVEIATERPRSLERLMSATKPGSRIENDRSLEAVDRAREEQQLGEVVADDRGGKPAVARERRIVRRVVGHVRREVDRLTAGPPSRDEVAELVAIPVGVPDDPFAVRAEPSRRLARRIVRDGFERPGFDLPALDLIGARAVRAGDPTLRPIRGDLDPDGSRRAEAGLPVGRSRLWFGRRHRHG